MAAKVIVANPGELAGAGVAVGGQVPRVADIAERSVTSAIEPSMGLAAVLAPGRAADVARRIGLLSVGGGGSLAGIGVGLTVDAAELGLAAADLVRADAAELLTTPVTTVPLSGNAADNEVVDTNVLQGRITGKYVVGAVEIAGDVKIETLAGGQVRVTLSVTGSGGIDLEILKAMDGGGGSASWVLRDAEQAERLLAQLAWAGARANPSVGSQAVATGLRVLVGNPARLPRPQGITRSVNGSREFSLPGVVGYKRERRDAYTVDRSVPGGRHERTITWGRTGSVEGGSGALLVGGSSGQETAVTVGRGRNGSDVTIRTKQADQVGTGVGTGDVRRGRAVIDATAGTRRGVITEETVQVRGRDAGTIRAAMAAGDDDRLRQAVDRLRDDARRRGTTERAVSDVTERHAGAGVDVGRAGLAVEGTVTRERPRP